jgi:hypothetical protein
MLSKRDLSALATMVRKDRVEVIEAVDFLSRLTARKRRRRSKRKASPKSSHRGTGKRSSIKASVAAVKD